MERTEQEIKKGEEEHREDKHQDRGPFAWHVDEKTRLVVIDGKIGERKEKIY